MAAGTIPLAPFAGVAVNKAAEQAVAVVVVIAGVGLIVTVTVKVAPTHDPMAPEVGVTVYIAVCAVMPELNKVPLMELAPVPDTPPVIFEPTVGAVQA